MYRRLTQYILRGPRLSIVTIIFVFFVVPKESYSQQQLPDSFSAKLLSESAEFYAPGEVQTVHLDIRESDLRKMREALPNRIYVPATLRWRKQVVENIGVRYKGNSSSHPDQQHKRSFLLKFNEYRKGQKFLGLQRVALDNGIQFGSLFSEQLITSVLRDLDIKASRCNFVKLYLNGSFHGVYTNVERIDSQFVSSHFGSPIGALYKVDEGGAGANMGSVPPNVPHKDLAFEEKSKPAHSDARDVIQLISKINETDDKEFAGAMEASICMDDFLKTMAVMLYSGAFDQLTGWNPHNYYLYHEQASNKWHYLPWDLDVGFADNAFRKIPVISGWNAAWPIAGGPPKPLIERIVNNSDLLARYRRFADEILEKYFHPDVIIPRLDALYDQVKDDLADDPFPKRRVTNPEDRGYESIIASMKVFIRRRYATARAQLDNPGPQPDFKKQRDEGPQPGKPSIDAPSELRVTEKTSTRISLKWTDNTKGEVAHIVQRTNGSNRSEFRNHIGKHGQDINAASDTKVTPGQTYRYRVYAIHATPTGPKGTGVSNVITVDVPKN